MGIEEIQLLRKEAEQRSSCRTHRGSAENKEDTKCIIVKNIPNGSPLSVSVV